MSKTGLTVKGGNTTRLGLLSRILDLTDKLTTKELRGEWKYEGYVERPFQNGEIEAIASVYKSVADTVATVNTNGQGITVTNCVFEGLDTGMRIEQSPEDKLEEITQEGSIEEDEKCDDCEHYHEEDSSCDSCDFIKHKGTL